MIARAPEGYRYYVPIALLGKSPPTSNIDLVDEDDRSLPLLNREQNAQLTHAAVVDLLEEIGGRTPSAALEGLLERVIRDDGLDAEFALEYAYVLIGEEYPGIFDSPKFAPLGEVLTDFAANSLIWVGLSGRPGARRVLQFRYDIAVELPPIPRQPPSVEYVLVETLKAQHTFEYAYRGDGFPSSTLERLWQRLANTIGWAAIDLALDSPYLRGCRSYHMQVAAPPGLECRDIRLIGDLTDSTGAPVGYQKNVTRRTAHLYFSDAKAEPNALITVTLLAGRRGFLTLSLLAGIVAAGMLWIYQGRTAQIGKDTSAAAAVLLVVPALLAIFSARPGEHALTARLLGGVRFLVLVSALGLVAGAAALVNVRPSAWDLKEAIRWYAVGDSAIAGVLMVSWLQSLYPVWAVRRRVAAALNSPSRLLYAGLLLTLLSAALAALPVLWDQVHQDAGVTVSVGLGTVAVAMFAVGATGLWVDSDSARWLPRSGLFIGSALTFAGAAAMVGVHPLSPDWSSTCRVVLIGLVATALVLAAIGLNWARPRK